MQRRGIYYSVLGDRDLWLSLGETGTLAAEAGLTLDQEAQSALFHATLGHPGIVLASLVHLPIECAAGVVTRDRAIGAYLAEEAPDRWPSAFTDFLALTVRLPRFTAREAAVLMRDSDASHFLTRLQALSLGRMVWHPGLQERVFRWD